MQTAEIGLKIVPAKYVVEKIEDWQSTRYISPSLSEISRARYRDSRADCIKEQFTCLQIKTA